MMETPFPKSISFAKKYSRLLEIVKPSDTLGILRNASFQGDAGKTARKIFGPWKGSAGGAPERCQGGNSTGKYIG